MALTQRERLLIARRAAGEYGSISQVEKIVRDHKRNREPADAMFLEFAILVTKKSWPWDDYERLQKLVLTEIPEPWGPKRQVLIPEDQEQPHQSKRRVVTCGICGGTGHNARTCPSRPDTPTVQHTDGIERLSPGFDPNPPGSEADNEGAP